MSEIVYLIENSLKLTKKLIHLLQLSIPRTILFLFLFSPFFISKNFIYYNLLNLLKWRDDNSHDW